MTKWRWRSLQSDRWPVFHKTRPKWKHNAWRACGDEIGPCPSHFWNEGIFGIIGAFFSLRRIK